jgi:hypothetical protein
MRLHPYRDESHSRHFDLIGGGGHPWSIDLVSVTASGILMVGFACALIAHWVHQLPAARLHEPAGFGRRAARAKARSLRLPFDGMRPLRRKGKGCEVPQLHRPLSSLDRTSGA